MGLECFRRHLRIGCLPSSRSSSPLLPSTLRNSLDCKSLTSEAVSDLCSQGCLVEALQCLRDLLRNPLPVSPNLFYCVLLGCIEKRDIHLGRETYCLIVQGGLDTDMFLGSHVIRMFASCGSLVETNQAFQKLPRKSVFTWSAIILAHANLEHGTSALELFSHMLTVNLKPDSYLFVAVLKACTSNTALISGKMIHSYIIVCGYEHVVHIGSTLVDMYVKCGSLKDGLRIFYSLPEKDLVTWNVVIWGCAQHLLVKETLWFLGTLFRVGLEPDQVTLISVLKVCASVKILDEGKLIHAHLVENGYELVSPVSSSIIHMYIKCGRFDAAFNVFTRLPNRDLVSWSAITTEHGSQVGQTMMFSHLLQMQSNGVVPDVVTFVCILKACSGRGAFYEGKQVHALYVESVSETDMNTSVGNTLIDMYFRCGSFEDAYNIFRRLKNRDLVTWNTLIGGCAQYKDCNMVFMYFRCLEQEGYMPDDVTFISLICACNNMGLVEIACHEFSSMHQDYGISPTLEHCNCMVDLLGHAGCLEEAKDFLLSMPVLSDAISWISILNHCNIYGDTSLANQCFEHLVSTGSRNASSFLLTSHVYAHADGQCNANKIEELRRSSNAWKKPGVASIAIGHQVYEFLVGGQDDSQYKNIYSKSKRLSVHMEEQGYVPSFGSIFSKEDMELFALS